MDTWKELASDFLASEAPRLRAARSEGELIAAMLHTQTALDHVLTNFIQSFEPSFDPAQVSFPDLVRKAQSHAPQVLTPGQVGLLISHNQNRNRVAHERYIPNRGEVLAFVQAAASTCEGLLEAPEGGRIERLAGLPKSVAKEYGGEESGCLWSAVVGAVYGAMASVVAVTLILGLGGFFWGLLDEGIGFGLLIGVFLLLLYFGVAAVPAAVTAVIGGIMGFLDGSLVSMVRPDRREREGSRPLLAGTMCAVVWSFLGYWLVRQLEPDWDLVRSLAIAVGLALLNGIVGYMTVKIGPD